MLDSKKHFINKIFNAIQHENEYVASLFF